MIDFLTAMPALTTTSDPTYILANPIFMVILIVLGLAVGTAIGASGIGGAALMVSSLLFLGVNPQAMVGASLFFNFITNIVGTALYSRKGNISWSAFKYVMIPIVPAMLFANWLWIHIETYYGSKILDLFILLPIGILLVCISGFMIKNTINSRKGNPSLSGQLTELRTNFSKKEKGTLIGLGGFVSFIIQISSVGAGAILVPALLKMVRSPKHVAGTSVAFGLVVSFIGTILHYSLGDVPIFLVAFLLIGSVPGLLIGVRIASTTSPRRLTIIFTILILISGLLILNKGLTQYT